MTQGRNISTLLLVGVEDSLNSQFSLFFRVKFSMEYVTNNSNNKPRLSYVSDT